MKMVGTSRDTRDKPVNIGVRTSRPVLVESGQLGTIDRRVAASGISIQSLHPRGLDSSGKSERPMSRAEVPAD